MLRRLKCEVEKQMPAKHEHVEVVPLSRRQQALYEESGRAAPRVAFAARDVQS
jgi:SNF2 family DNA or RNA helicase